MNHRRVLENMRTLIDHGWTQGCGARNAGNVRVEITAPDACRWCLVGAAHLATLAEPDDGWHDENVLVDRYGNITQRQVIEEKPPNDA